MKNRYMLPMILAFGLILGCTHSQKVSQSTNPIEQNVEMYPGYSVSKYKDIYFSGQPELGDLPKLKKMGITNIVNLRLATEGSYREAKEAAAAKKNELNYSHIPMSGRAPLSDELISKITQAVIKNRSAGKTLIHCGSGQRVAYWAGGHFYKDHGVSKQEALEIAKRIGLTKEPLVRGLEKYLNINE